MSSKRISPLVTAMSFAPGRSSTRRGSEIEAMPSCTVPMFSNRPDISHMIHCDMPHIRSTRPMTTATAPIVTAWPSHSHSDSAVTENKSSALRM